MLDNSQIESFKQKGFLVIRNFFNSDFMNQIIDSPQSQIFFFEDYKSSNYFWKQFFSGVFIAIAMTGLDQDMMQKNLTCKSLKDCLLYTSPSPRDS